MAETQIKKPTFKKAPATLGDLDALKISPREVIGEIEGYNFNLSWEKLILLCNSRVVEKEYHISMDSKIVEAIQLYGDVMADGGIF